MKKSKFIKLVLITSALASCHKEPLNNTNDQKVYMRSDSTAHYSRTHCYGHGNGWLWYYAFRPYGYYNGGYGSGNYNHVGYYSGGISENSNLGSNHIKTSHSSSHSSRGGFGSGGFHVSS